MKPVHRIIFCVAVAVAASVSAVHAQTASGKMNIDTDLYILRNITIPSFDREYDDYLQYMPGALTVGLKICGYEGRSSWSRMLVSDAFSVAAMAITVNGLKYTVSRLRPDGSSYNSFPSGHTATAFMTATMLHKEYGWKSPWFSIGAYTTAAVTGMSRVLNNRHWVSDVVAGAAIGIGSVHLGYFLSDLIFKDKGIYSGYCDPIFLYDASKKHYTAEMIFGKRLIIGSEGLKKMGALPVRGGLTGISTDIPLIPGAGITARATASSMTYISGTASEFFSLQTGGFWNYHFAGILEFQCKAMIGGGWLGAPDTVPCSGHENIGTIGDGHQAKIGGISLGAGAGLSLITDNNFKIKVFADLESISLSPTRPWLNTVILGFGTGWFW